MWVPFKKGRAAAIEEYFLSQVRKERRKKDALYRRTCVNQVI